jgi:hypothetical protein
MREIRQRNDGRWRTSVNGREITARTKEELEDKLADSEADGEEEEEGDDLFTADSHEDNYADLFDAAIAMQDADDATDTDTEDVEFNWGDKPVGLLLPSDWHVGSRWTNYRRLRNDVSYIGDFREAFPHALHLAHLGDLADNYFAAGKHPSGMHETLITRTDKQRNTALWLAKQAGSWDWMLLGCHLAWNLTQVGEDVLAPIAKELGAVNGGFGLNARVTVGEQTYNILTRHKALGGAALNPGNQQRRMDDEYGPYGERADAICTSHQHVCYMQTQPKAGRHVVYTRSGGYKGGDCFARGGGFTHTKTADCGIPLLILLPNEHRIIPFDGHSWKDGLELLRMLRSDA